MGAVDFPQGFELCVGVDEAGRGPLAGPVVAAAVAVRAGALEQALPVVADSKVMSEEERERAFHELVNCPHVQGAIAIVPPALIDEVNILQCTYIAMTAAVDALPEQAGMHVLVDGNRMPPRFAARAAGTEHTLPLGARFSVETMVKGDSRVWSIAAASVLAKVARDALMVAADAKYPGYGLAQHKGYPTGAHMAAVAKLGPSPYHRLTFAPLKGNYTRADAGPSVPVAVQHLADLVPKHIPIFTAPLFSTELSPAVFIAPPPKPASKAAGAKRGRPKAKRV